jgi:hypothetical protein
MSITKEIMSDINGNLSSKRLVTIISLALIAAGYIANLVYGKVVDENMFNSIMYIVIAGLGFTGAEQFAPARSQ